MTSFRQSSNYYEILEVAPDAAQNEIYRAYQRAKSTYTQDNPALYSMFNPDEARELVKMIEEAYSVLGNHMLRQSYDEALIKARGATVAAMHATSNNHGGGSNTSMMSHRSSHVTPSAHDDLPEIFGGQGMSTNSASPPQHQQSASLHPQSMNPHRMALDELEAFSAARARENMNAKSVVQEGHGRTSLSTYKIDADFENEIASTLAYDGEQIKKIREYKNVTIEKISEATRVSRTYLNAMEANQYSKLPAPVFVRGFVVQVAKILGLDDALVANSYMKIYSERSVAKK